MLQQYVHDWASTADRAAGLPWLAHRKDCKCKRGRLNLAPQAIAKEQKSTSHTSLVPANLHQVALLNLELAYCSTQ